MPEWPELPITGAPESWMLHGGADYQRARADAWEARCRVAVAVLQDVRLNAHTLEDAIGYATEALAAIGPLPPLPPLPELPGKGE